jgi:hypothetical protein
MPSEFFNSGRRPTLKTIFFSLYSSQNAAAKPSLLHYHPSKNPSRKKRPAKIHFQLLAKDSG